MMNELANSANIPSFMKMRELREFVNENGLFYAHVRNGKIAIYADRYHYKRLGFVFVEDSKSCLGRYALGIYLLYERVDG